MELLQYNLFQNFNEIIHFCTTRVGNSGSGNYGSSNFSATCGDDPDNLIENIRQLSDYLNITPEKIIIPTQTHSNCVKCIENDFFKLTLTQKKDFLQSVDALVTSLHGVCIGITTADCVPVTFYDPSKQIIAVAHAGWRGTSEKIVVKTINYLKTHFNCNPENLFATIGPCISQEMYPTGKEVADVFSEAGFPVDELIKFEDGKYFPDLKKTNRWLLTENGIPESQIEVSDICTFSNHENFFSARKLGFYSGRMLSGIMLK